MCVKKILLTAIATLAIISTSASYSLQITADNNYVFLPQNTPPSMNGKSIIPSFSLPLTCGKVGAFVVPFTFTYTDNENSDYYLQNWSTNVCNFPENMSITPSYGPPQVINATCYCTSIGETLRINNMVVQHSMGMKKK